VRPGYTPDEEFTVYAVRGIAEHGLPLLPSGLLYDRGILYSYAGWIAHALTGSELPVYRALSLAAAAMALWLTYKLMSRIRHPAAGVLAMALVGTSVPFVATATTARFYAPFLALYLAALLMLRRNVAGLALVVALCRLTHELAFTLAAIPVMCWLVDRGRRREWFRAAIAVGVGLIASQLLLFALHAAAPSSGETMVRRFFVWQVLNLFERPGDRQFAIPLVVMVVSWLIAPRHAWIMTVSSLSVATMIVAFSIAQASNAAPISLALAANVLSEGSRYPLDMFWHVARTTPLTLAVAVLAMLQRLHRAPHLEWSPAERAVHGLWVGWLLWFGVIDSGITTNYLLLPVAFMLMAIAVDAHAMLTSGVAPARGFTRSRPAVVALIIGLVAMVIVDQWRATTLDVARPTIVADGIADIRNELQPNDRVACTDELGCLMLIGRIDRWLALDEFVRERFVVRRGADAITGVYTGVPAVFRPVDLLSPNPDFRLPDRVIIVDIFKDYPIGNSRSWLPMAIERDGLQVRPLLETPQLRILEISPQERVARFR